ncbi:hypothetical protein OS128_05300 [Corynebacterium sp. P5848]|nr:hypothetical protein [Corynebacterium marambiense]MCX7542327.1 hypothetical protein [Corynebacterium marambiense]
MTALNLAAAIGEHIGWGVLVALTVIATLALALETTPPAPDH